MATAFKQSRASMAIALPRHNTEQLCFIFSPITSVFSLLFRSVGYGKPSLSRKLLNKHYITLHYITLHYITLHYITLHYITLHYITLHYITLKVYFFSLGTVICMHQYLASFPGLQLLIAWKYTANSQKLEM